MMIDLFLKYIKSNWFCWELTSSIKSFNQDKYAQFQLECNVKLKAPQSNRSIILIFEHIEKPIDYVLKIYCEKHD